MKPIIFSGPMIKALLNTNPCVWPAKPIDPSKPCKSMTRRVVKPQPPECVDLFEEWHDGFRAYMNLAFREPCSFAPLIPRYKKGDILYVKETFGVFNDEDNVVYLYYKADEGESKKPKYFGKWKSPRFMHREAARIFLEVKSVRIEKLQNISEEDARAEGIKHTCPQDCPPCGGSDCTDYITAYRELWDSINGKKKGCSWDDSPWVFVYSFMRIK